MYNHDNDHDETDTTNNRNDTHNNTTNRNDNDNDNDTTTTTTTNTNTNTNNNNIMMIMIISIIMIMDTPPGRGVRRRAPGEFFRGADRGWNFIAHAGAVARIFAVGSVACKILFLLYLKVELNIRKLLQALLSFIGV